MDLRVMAVVAAAIAVDRLAPAGERVARAIGLARELGISRRALYSWRDRPDQSDPPPARSREPTDQFEGAGMHHYR